MPEIANLTMTAVLDNIVDKTVAVAILGDAQLVPVPKNVQVGNTRSVAQEGVSTKTTTDAEETMARSRQAKIKAISDVQTASMYCQEVAGAILRKRTGWVMDIRILCGGRSAEKTVLLVHIITVSDARPINQILCVHIINILFMNKMF